MKKTFFIILTFLPFAAFSWLQESYWTGSNRAFLSWGSYIPVKLSFNLNGNPKTTDSGEYASLITAINSWNALYPSQTSFYFTAETTTNDTANGLDGINTVSFSNLGAISTVAETRTTFFVSSGQVIDADVTFNNYYNFVGGSQPTQGTNINLADVATHEFGHAFGLGHTPMTGTMYFSAQDKQRILSQDEIAAISSLYPSSFSQIFNISGTVKKAGTPMFGAHVIAIRVDEGPWQGKPWVSDLTNTSGQFNIRGLDNSGKYILYVAPIQNINPFGSYFNGAHDETDFVETFYTGSQEEPLIFSSLTTNSGINIPVSLNLLSDAKYEGSSNNNSQGKAFNLDLAASSVLVAKAEDINDTDYYKINLQAGQRLDVRATAYELRSPRDLKLTIVAPSETVSIENHPYETDPVNKDPFYFQYEVKADGDHYIKVSVTKTLNASEMRGSTSDGVSLSPFYILSWNKRATGTYPSIVTPSGCSLSGSSIKCSILEDSSTVFNFSGTGTFSALKATINKLLIQDISFQGNQMTVTPQPGMAGETKVILARKIGSNTTYQDFIFDIQAVNDPPFVFTSQSQLNFNVISGSKINLTLSSIGGDDTIDHDGYLVNGTTTRVSGVLPTSTNTLTATSNNPNVTASVSIENGSYMLLVTGPIGESAKISFALTDNGSNPSVSGSSGSSIGTLVSGLTTSSSTSSGPALTVNIVSSLSSPLTSPTSGGGLCGTVFKGPYDGDFNQFANLLIFLTPLIYLFIRRRRIYYV